MTDRPSRSEFALKFFQGIGDDRGGDTEGAIALNVRACEAVLADLIDLYDAGFDRDGPGCLVLRLFQGARQSAYVTLDDMRSDLQAAQQGGTRQEADFFRDLLQAVDAHNHRQAALVALIDNGRAELLPVPREYPAASVEELLRDLTQ